jgi:DNA-binding response OmpR family regulator
VKKILLVEDTANLAEEIVEVLQWSGYEVIWASGGDKALEMLKDYPAELIVTDHCSTSTISSARLAVSSTNRIFFTGWAI